MRRVIKDSAFQETLSPCLENLRRRSRSGDHCHGDRQTGQARGRRRSGGGTNQAIAHTPTVDRSGVPENEISWLSEQQHRVFVRSVQGTPISGIVQVRELAAKFCLGIWPMAPGHDFQAARPCGDRKQWDHALDGFKLRLAEGVLIQVKALRAGTPSCLSLRASWGRGARLGGPRPPATRASR